MDKFGKDVLPEEIIKANEKPKTRYNDFEFIHCVRPNKNRDARKRDYRNMPFESVYVCVKGKKIVSSGGFEEFPFSVVRWMKSSDEIYGRGQGTEHLPDIRMIQKMKRDFIDCANRWCNPPREVVANDIEGPVNVTPGGINYVSRVNSIRALDQAINGNFPITKDMLEQQAEVIHKIFFRDVFIQISELRGDRRTQYEIQERLKEGLRRLAMPVTRLQRELLDPTIQRSFNLLVRNGVIAPPPMELQGKKIRINHLGQLSLALRDQQSRGFIQFASVIGELAPVFPEAPDIIDIDDALPDIAQSGKILISEELNRFSRKDRQGRNCFNSNNSYRRCRRVQTCMPRALKSPRKAAQCKN